MKSLAIVQARTGSTRFPAKILQKINEKTLLQIQIERMKKSKLIDEIVIASTINPNDDEIEVLCRELGYNLYRGSEFDLLDRHYRTAKFFNADNVVKIPSDCPLIDPEIIDKVINTFITNINSFDYVSNLHPPTYPDGNDVEIMTFHAIETAWSEATELHQREHTTPYIYENPDRFRIGNVIWDSGKDYSNSLRLTIDYQEDFDFIKAIYEELDNPIKTFHINDILNLLERKPELAEINSMHNGKFWYNSIKEDSLFSEI